MSWRKAQVSTKQLLGDEPVPRDFGSRDGIRGNFIRSGYDFFTRRLVLLLFLVAVAATIGTVVSKAEWLFLGAIAFLCIGLLAPVPAALGGFALLIPFDSLLALGSTDDQSRSLTWFVGAGAAGLLLFAGVVGRRLKAPPVSARWWIAFTCWAAASCLWALNPSTAARQLPTLCAFLILYIAAACIQISEKEIQWTVALATIGGLVASAITIYQFYQGRFYAEVTMRGSLTVGDREANPNAFAAHTPVPAFHNFGRVCKSEAPIRTSGYSDCDEFVVICDFFNDVARRSIGNHNNANRFLLPLQSQLAPHCPYFADIGFPCPANAKHFFPAHTRGFGNGWRRSALTFGQLASRSSNTIS